MSAYGDAQGPDLGNVDREFAEAQVRTLIQAIDAKDPAGHPSIDLALGFGPRWIRRDSTATVMYGLFMAIYDKRTGNCLDFEVGCYPELLQEGWKVEPEDMLDEETCLAFAKEYLRIVEPSSDVHFVRSRQRGQLFIFEMNPKVADLPLLFPWEIYIEIDRRKGQLVKMMLPARIPDVSLANAQRVQETVARAAAEQAYLRHRPFASGHLQGGPLMLGVPGFMRLPNELTAEHVALAQQNRAIPLYCFLIGNTPTWDPQRKSFHQSQTVFVDARTGRALAIWETSGRAGGEGRLEWPAGPVAVGEDEPELAGAALTPVDTPKNPPAGGVDRIVRFGDKLLVVGFDAASGLCWLGQGVERIYAKPNTALRRALEKSGAVPPASFGGGQAQPG
jgi:hypothetical protein